MRKMEEEHRTLQPETTTQDLLDRLRSGESLTEFLENNADAFLTISLEEYLKAVLHDKKKTRAALIRDSEINRRYFYDILCGRRHPERNYVLRLLLALKTSFRDAQWLLKATGYPQFYVRNRRDSVIVYALDHGLCVRECNAMLEKIDLEPI
jgi:hypothetical protein